MTDLHAELGVVGLTLLAWAVVAYVVAALPPSPGAQAILYTAGLVALAGTAALLLQAYHNRPGARGQMAGAINYLGGGMRFALAMEFALWLQSLRMLTAVYLVFIVGGFLFIELLFRYAAGDRGRPRRSR